MRIRVADVAAFVLIAPLAAIAPAGATTPPPPFLSFTVSPVAGPSGTQITVSGLCTAGTTVNLSLEYPLRSDAIPPPIDSTTVQVDQSNAFTATLHNDIAQTQQVPPDDPIDLEVNGSCGGQYRTQPFASTNRTTSNTSTIFTGLGLGPCGYAYVPAGVDSAIGCTPHV